MTQREQAGRSADVLTGGQALERPGDALFNEAFHPSRLPSSDVLDIALLRIPAIVQTRWPTVLLAVVTMVVRWVVTAAAMREVCHARAELVWISPA